MKPTKKRIVILISGRGSNMAAIVQQAQNGILKDCCEILLVFSNQPDAAGLTKAASEGIAVAAIPSAGKKRNEFDREVLQLLAPLQPDFIVLAGYMRILSKEFIAAYAGKIINIHPADTKRHQGLGAYEWAFENKLPETKITVHFVDEGVDTGNIIAQKSVNLRNTQTLQEVQRRGLAVEHEFYSQVLASIFSGG